MNIKKYSIFIMVFILILLSSNVYSMEIKKINEMSTNELIDHGRQLEKREEERQKIEENIQIQANNKFNDVVKKENNELL